MLRSSSPYLAALAGLSLVCVGCDARVLDLRPPALTSADQGTVADLGPVDAGPPVDLGPEAVLLRGALSGLNGYGATGDVEIVSQGGMITVRLTNGYSSAGVPGPRLVLTTRDTLGSSGIQPSQGDIDLGPIATSGELSIPAPAGAAGAVYAWIYCFPFSVDTARAPLVMP